MTVVSLKPDYSRRDGTFKAEFSDGSSFLFSPEYLPDRFDPALWETSVLNTAAVNTGANSTGPEYAGRDLAQDEEEAFRFAAACYRAESSALRLIARAEQNSLGLTAKLERRGYDAAVVKAVIFSLLDRNLLNDQRYAEIWLRSRLLAKKAESPRRLLFSLRKRGIPRDSSSEAMKTALDGETEYVLLLRYLENAWSGDGKRTISLKSRLRYEGFSLAAIDRYYDTF